jgi:hypothetical protein
MKAIKENPYRILGLFGNATEKEMQKQIATIKRFAEVGKTKSFDYDFPFLGDFKREQETVTEAASRIEQAKNKVCYSLFWFLNTNHIDEAALNHLKEANIDKAIEIWEKLIKDYTITAKNYSAALNLSTLQLGLTTLNGSFNPEQFKKCVELKGNIIASDAFRNFVQTVAGDNTSVSKDIIRKEFVDEVLQILKLYINKSNGITSTQLIDAFNSFPTETKQYVSAKFTDRPLSNIDNQIEKTKQKRTDKALDAEEYGAELYKNTKEDLKFLKNVLGAINVNYQVLVNKVANEILQCAIDFFLELRDSEEYDPGEPAMKVMKMAKAINPTGQIKNRLDENIENVQEWIDDSEEREKNKRVKGEFEFLASRLQRFQNLSDSISNAKDLITSCKPKLIKIKKELGLSEQLYINISSAVVQNAQNMLVSSVNNETEKLNSISRLSIGVSTISLKSSIKEALDVMYSLGQFDMFSELRNHYNKNIEALKSLARQFSISTLNPKERIEKEINEAESELRNIQSRTFFKNELDLANKEMASIKQWTFMRSQADKDRQYNALQSKIKQILIKGEQEKANKIWSQQEIISTLKSKLKEL